MQLESTFSYFSHVNKLSFFSEVWFLTFAKISITKQVTDRSRKLMGNQYYTEMLHRDSCERKTFLGTNSQLLRKHGWVFWLLLVTTAAPIYCHQVIWSCCRELHYSWLWPTLQPASQMPVRIWAPTTLWRMDSTVSSHSPGWAQSMAPEANLQAGLAARAPSEGWAPRFPPKYGWHSGALLCCVYKHEAAR